MLHRLQFCIAGLKMMGIHEGTVSRTNLTGAVAGVATVIAFHLHLALHLLAASYCLCLLYTAGIR